MKDMTLMISANGDTLQLKENPSKQEERRPSKETGSSEAVCVSRTAIVVVSIAG